MARRWTITEEYSYRKELEELYVVQNKTIGEIGIQLGMSEKGIYTRLIRLKIPVSRHLKERYNDQRSDLCIPNARTAELAEFFGIMLGDGHVDKYQTFVTLGTKELSYVQYVRKVMSVLFGVQPHLLIDRKGYHIVYIGSVLLTRWLRSEGLVTNKVAAQVGVPKWIFEENDYMRSFLRGFFDTDGSVYGLRHGRQISLTNHSLPLLVSLRNMLIALEYKPSEISTGRVYITRKNDIDRFFKEVKPANSKHTERYRYLSEDLTRRYPSG